MRVRYILNMLGRGLLLPLAMILAGCYDGQSDLIGSHAAEVRALDSVIIFRDVSYFATAVGRDITLCPLNAPSDSRHPCASPYRLKIERTQFGHYIVQLYDGRKYSFGLWYRPLGGGPDEFRQADCFLILGEDIVGQNLLGTLSKSDHPISVHGGEKGFSELRAALAPFGAEHLMSRQELLAVVDAYQRTVFSMIEPSCPGDHLHFGNPRGVVIQGDNRNLPAFDSPN